jgi:hypothetical protein
MGTLMKPDHKIVFALIVGAVTGGAIVQALHAESKPPAYVVGEVDVANHDAFVKEYVPLAMKALKVAMITKPLRLAAGPL